ncbi:cin4p [Saccharomyces arboricola H-6]|uniref:Cin4p n=1 Tax=Saccharomyces arboricola (strain H-6 / AS 2.3317 / CBS 10644) TaxID=1160507 RepID=J8Q9I7_SACAR|nr:cin4p [Saccharomyces arboricola H-6]
MGLLSIIRKQKLKDREIRCLILGLDNSGKSTIVNKLLPKDEQRANGIMPTVGFQIYGLMIQDVMVSLWDIGGQRSLRPFWDNYFDKTQVMIWCIDISLLMRFSETMQELTELINRDENRIGHDCAVIIALNKIDLVEDKSELYRRCKLVESKLKCLFKPDIRIAVVQCSGITGEGIDTLRDRLIESCIFTQ